MAPRVVVHWFRLCVWLPWPSGDPRALVYLVTCGVHWRLLIAFHHVALVRNCYLVSLRCVVKDGIGNVLQQRWPYQLRTLLGWICTLFRPNDHLFLSLLYSWRWRQQRELRWVSLIDSACDPSLVFLELVPRTCDAADGTNRAHGILELLLRTVGLIRKISISGAHFVILAIGLIEFESEFLVNNMTLFGELTISLWTILTKRFIVRSSLRVCIIRYNLRRTQSIAVLQISWLIGVAHDELSSSCRYTILILLLRTLAKTGASRCKISLTLSSLNAG